MEIKHRIFYFGALLFLSDYSPVSTQTFECPTYFVEINGKCYFFSQQIPFQLSWDDARNYCFEYTSGSYSYDLLVYGEDIDEPVLISEEMSLNDYDNATIGARDLGLAFSEWAWIDAVPLFHNSSFWDCFYPNNTDNTHVALLNRASEDIAGGETAKRYRLRDVKKESLEYFICEGEPLPQCTFSETIRNKGAPLLTVLCFHLTIRLNVYISNSSF